MSKRMWSEQSAMKALEDHVLDKNPSYVFIDGGKLTLRLCSAMDYLLKHYRMVFLKFNKPEKED